MVEATIKSFENLKYLDGYLNHHASEALPGALPIGQNTPQKVKYGLYAEQLTGTAFTAPREKNLRSWLYRCLPAVTHSPFKPIDKKDNYSYILNDFMNSKDVQITPNQLRWRPLPFPKEEKKINFIEGLVTVCGAGHPSLKEGIAIYLYSANASMTNKAFYSSDGDFLIVPQTGKLYITSEFGKFTVEPFEIAVIPRGIRFSVDVTEPVRGWITEVFKGHFIIPGLGPIGANGLANPRDFQVPTAFYEKVEGTYTVINKYQGEMFESEQNHSCFDVVAWHGNYYPCKYNLRYFNAMNSVTFDHPDPSIFTVITCQSDEPGTAICDFVIFPPRWMVAEHTFRPPYYHRNTMSEFMGNIAGTYDAKETGFGPGCSSLHSGMTPHGPETDVFEKSSEMELKPVRYPDTSMSFMFESCLMFRTTSFVMDNLVKLDHDYYLCWQKLKNNFKIE